MCEYRQHVPLSPFILWLVPAPQQNLKYLILNLNSRFLTQDNRLSGPYMNGVNFIQILAELFYIFWNISTYCLLVKELTNVWPTVWLENVLSCMSFKVVFWSKHCHICWTELKEIIETFVTIIISLIIALKILMSGVRTIRTICSRLLVTSLT